MAIDYTALKSELTNDPNTYGYQNWIAAREPEKVAAALNKIRDGNDGEAAITIRRPNITAKEIWEAINVADYTALPASPTAAQLSTERRYLAWMSGLPTLGTVRLLNDDGSDGPVTTNLKAMFPGGSGTLTRLAAIASRNGSRAEQLFGADVVISVTDVITALALP